MLHLFRTRHIAELQGLSEEKADAVVSAFLELVRERTGKILPFLFAIAALSGIAFFALFVPAPWVLPVWIFLSPSVVLIWILENYWTWHHGIKHHRELLAAAVERVEKPEPEVEKRFLQWPANVKTKGDRVLIVGVIILAGLIVLFRLVIFPV